MIPTDCTTPLNDQVSPVGARDSGPGTSIASPGRPAGGADEG